ncbi:hypothetical protein CW751_13250 [Brumimicrobium salinarum]|uniref:DUF7793 domain-containing protein n=1 Tax=Brumimicrobium salinarum TaxID=2058658 RepID=A0A2I0QZM8_9FLAO|nr:hypothetical protein [Brumimicrobium salinarum]PKR79792.1 hypothetical protein CW751_13250 [Brumimicrobium salinarum]
MEADIEILRLEIIKHGKIELRSDEILTFRPDIATFKDYDLQVFKDLLEVFLDVTKGTPRPYLCDNTYVTGIVDKEALTFMNDHFDRFATKAAMITKSPITRVIVNGYNSVFKPKVKFKLFTSEEKAVKWLLK